MATYPCRFTALAWNGSSYTKDADGILCTNIMNPAEPDFLPGLCDRSALRIISPVPIPHQLNWLMRTSPIATFRFSDTLAAPAPAGYAMISASLVRDDTIRLTFGVSVTMVDPTGVNDALNPKNYDVRFGGSYMPIASITTVSPTQVDLHFSAVLLAGTYSVRVHGVQSLASLFPNATGGNDTVSVTVPVNSPTVLSVTSSEVNVVQVVFSKAMDRTSATNPANYTISSGVKVLSVTVVSDTIFLLNTAGETPSSSYSLTCSSAITDTFGNPLV